MSKKISLNKIRLFAMDVDGTLTDGKIYMGEQGELMKAFDVKDGLGLKLLINNQIIPAVITGRTSQIVANRCKEIGITELYQGIHDKDTVLLSLMEKYNLKPEETAYIGDDLNDLSAIKAAGVSFAPADCGKQIIPYVDVILNKKAGDCPVREAIDMILESKGDYCTNL
jgi:3-deoxy-D-manno-octulosonate 8-phosphate phosphatase (KDO 8-P phosphatase)